MTRLLFWIIGSLQWEPRMIVEFPEWNTIEFAALSRGAAALNSATINRITDYLVQQ